MMAGRERPAGGFELYAWLFMRVSGILLVGLALGHLYIMHLQHGVHEIDFTFVAQRFSLPLWRVYDWLMLFLALLHGLNGLRTLLDDYVRSRRWRCAGVVLLYGLGAVFLVLGSWVILFFQAVA